MVKESLYYPYVARFLRRELGCFAANERTGPSAVGYADVLGVRDIGGSYSGDVELVAVEVKLDSSNFGKRLGQALGYSLFAHKCYLAVPMKKREWFTAEQREMATRLGVGLIEIRGWRARQCAEVLSSQYHEPINALMLRALWRMNYFRCAICGMITRSDDDNFTTKTRTAIDEGKMLYFGKRMVDGKKIRTLMFKRGSEEGMFKTTFICPDCLKRVALGPD